MNTLFLIHRYPPALGGSERYVQEVARRLAAAGHKTTVYTSTLLEVQGFWRRGSQQLPAGMEYDVASPGLDVAPPTQDAASVTRARVEVHRYRPRVLPLHSAMSRVVGRLPWSPVGLGLAPPGLVLPGMWQAVRAAKGFELIYAAAYPSLMYLGAVAARRMGARLVLMPCSHPEPVTDRAAVRAAAGRRSDEMSRQSPSRRLVQLYRQADALVALTDLEKVWLTGSGIAPSRIVVTGAGVDPAAGAGARGNRFRRKHGLDDSASVIAFVGQKTAGKGALDLLEASRQLLRRRPDLVVAMVGTPTRVFRRQYEALPPEMRPRVLDLRLGEADKHDLLAASAGLVLPSREDSFGIVLLEAWLHSKPVIGARAGGIPAVIEDGITGLLVPPGDVPALTAAIDHLLDHPLASSGMGSRGRQRALSQWTWDAVFSRLAPVLESGKPLAPGEMEQSA